MGICIDTHSAARIRDRFKFRSRQDGQMATITSLRIGMPPIGRSSVKLIVTFLNLIEVWRARSTQRRRLRTLDERLLKDFGATRCDAEAEFRKPFWRP